jgi:hypothetical protein
MAIKNARMNDAKNSVVAIYKTPVQAEIAVRQMEYAEFNLQQVSLLWCDPAVAADGPRAGVRRPRRSQPTRVVAEIQGMLSGSARFPIPGLGEVFVAGALVERIMCVPVDAAWAAGLTSLGASLFQLGLSKDSVLQYEAALAAGKGLVLARGIPEEMSRVREILDHTQPDTLADHQPVRPPDECYAAGRYFPARPIYPGPPAPVQKLILSR